MSASRPVDTPPGSTAPLKERAASASPERTSTGMPVTSRMVSTASPVLEMLRREAVAKTCIFDTWKLSSRAR